MDGEEKMILRKKGQVSIWIVLAVVLMASVVLFFLLGRNPRGPAIRGGESAFDVESFLDGCVRDSVEEGIDIMLPKGGFVNPQNVVYYNNTDIEYICDNIGYYEPCINQHPMLLNEFKREIRNYVLPRVNECLEDMKDDFGRRGSVITFNGASTELKVGLGIDKVFLEVLRDMTLRKGEKVRNFENLKVEVDSPAYNLATIAMEIASQEAKYCYFEYVGYSILHPRYKINKFVMSSSTKIYTISDSKTGKKMNVAVRGCAIPAGF